MLYQSEKKKKANTMKVRAMKAFGITLLAFWLSFIMMQPFSFSAASLLSSSDGNDFTINDFYNKVADSRAVSTLDDNIVIVDIASSDREEIAEVIETVSLCGPRAVGLDVVFIEPREHDARLIEAMENCPNLIAAVSVEPDPEAEDRFKIDEHTYFSDRLENATIGAINFPTQHTNRTIREFRPDYKRADGTDLPSFALAVSEMNATEAAKENAKKFRERENKNEVIRFYSRIFKTFSPDELADRAEELSDKIVLIGAINDPADLHATPVKSAMSGILIHAHAAATILSGSYFYQLEKTANWAIAFLSCFIVILVSLSIHAGVKGLLLRLLQVLLLYLSIRIGYYFFIEHDVIINFSYTLMMLTFGLFACDIWIGCATIVKWIASKVLKPGKTTNNSIYTQ